MPALRFFMDHDRGAQAGWNRLQLSGGITGTGVDKAAGTVIDQAGDVIAGVAIDVPDGSIYNTTTGPTLTSGDAAWVSPSTHFADGLRLSTVDGWHDIVISGLGTQPHTVELFGWGIGADGRAIHGRVNGGTSQILNVSANTQAESANIIRFENVVPVSGAITIGIARHSSSIGNAYFHAGRIFPYVAPTTMTVETDDGVLMAGNAFSILCEEFAAAPDGATFTVNTLVDGVTTRSDVIGATVTNNGDGTYTLTGTMPALPASGSTTGPRFTDAPAGITHTMSVATV